MLHADQLRVYLARNTAATVNQRNVLLVEGLSPQLIDIPSTDFDIHLSFFVDHERVVVFKECPNKTYDSTRLPSSIKRMSGTKGLALKYYEVLRTILDPPGFELFCADIGRYIIGVIKDANLENAQFGLFHIFQVSIHVRVPFFFDNNNQFQVLFYATLH